MPWKKREYSRRRPKGRGTGGLLIVLWVASQGEGGKLFPMGDVRGKGGGLGPTRGKKKKRPERRPRREKRVEVEAEEKETLLPR